MKIMVLDDEELSLDIAFVDIKMLSAPQLLERNFEAEKPNSKWVAF